MILAVIAFVAHLDHIMVAVADLDRGTAEVKASTGVAPVYGGKHPGGTHNALLSLGDHTYLELISVQPGKANPADLPDFSRLPRPTPVMWGVSATDMASLRDRLQRAGFSLSEPEAGSRVTPAGTTLRWQSADLQQKVRGAPFFLVWAAGTPHPSSTSPAGCTLVSFQITTPDAKQLRDLVSALGIKVDVVNGPAELFSVTLACPKGRVTFK